jgi:hypothetical protein
MCRFTLVRKTAPESLFNDERQFSISIGELTLWKLSSQRIDEGSSSLARTASPSVAVPLHAGADPVFSEFRIFTPEAALFVTSSSRFGSQLFQHKLVGSGQRCREFERGL